MELAEKVMVRCPKPENGVLNASDSRIYLNGVFVAKCRRTHTDLFNVKIFNAVDFTSTSP